MFERFFIYEILLLKFLDLKMWLTMKLLNLILELHELL